MVAQELDPFTHLEFEKDFVSENKLLKYRRPKDDSQGQIDNFDYSSFFTKFPILKETGIRPWTVSAGYLTYIKRLLQEGRIGTAVSYHGSYASLKKFRMMERYSDVTAMYLIQYEQWLPNQNLSRSTVGIYIRPLRCIFNEALLRGLLKRKNAILLVEGSIKFRPGGTLRRPLQLLMLRKFTIINVNLGITVSKKPGIFGSFVISPTG